jgi:hypothetical protein
MSSQSITTIEASSGIFTYADSLLVAIVASSCEPQTSILIILFLVLLLETGVMLHHNRVQRTSEDVDASEDVEFASSTIIAGSFDNATPLSAVRKRDPPPTFPRREVVDVKNTLQSFDSHDPPVSILPLLDQRPTLPNGQVINAKNTLQSFDTQQRNQRTPIDPPDDPPDEGKRSSNNEPPNPTVAMTHPSTMAVTMATDIVYAELAPELGDRNLNTVDVPTAPWYHGRFTLALLTIVAISVAIGLGLYFGVSNGLSNETVKNSNSLPTSAPMLAVTSMHPTLETASMNPTLEMFSTNVNLTIRTNVLTSYINSITLSNQTITANGTSPESMALAWMIANDTTLDTATLISQDNHLSQNALGFLIRQQYPLLVMWFQQTETAKWAITTGWLVDSSECAWYGISCQVLDVYYDDDKLNGGSENVVTKITFDLIGSYVGIIPLDISLLSHLQHFEVQNTRNSDDEIERCLKGSLPESIGQWTALTYFSVASNFLSGKLPESIGQWTDLTYFNISVNSFDGTLPESIGQWTALTSFDVYMAVLNGTLPGSIGQWTALEYFNINGNFLTGILPDSVGSWTALMFFDAYGNTLTGPLAIAFSTDHNGSLADSQGSALTYFDVSYNELTGKLPDNIGQWTGLTYFSIYDNAVNGTLPDSIGLLTALTYCDVSYSDLTGTLPFSIGEWTGLTYFDAYDNAFSGMLPDSIFQWTSLSRFFVDGNDFTGTLPESIGIWTAMTYFSVTGNSLNGTIPQSVGNWSLIENAYFEYNPFVGTMPTIICQFVDPDMDTLVVDCTVNCTCCTDDCVSK